MVFLKKKIDPISQNDQKVEERNHESNRFKEIIERLTINVQIVLNVAKPRTVSSKKPLRSSKIRYDTNCSGVDYDDECGI